MSRLSGPRVRRDCPVCRPGPRRALRECNTLVGPERATNVPAVGARALKAGRLPGSPAGLARGGGRAVLPLAPTALTQHRPARPRSRPLLPGLGGRTRQPPPCCGAARPCAASPAQARPPPSSRPALKQLTGAAMKARAVAHTRNGHGPHFPCRGAHAQRAKHPLTPLPVREWAGA